MWLNPIASSTLSEDGYYSNTHAVVAYHLILWIESAMVAISLYIVVRAFKFAHFMISNRRKRNHKSIFNWIHEKSKFEKCIARTFFSFLINFECQMKQKQIRFDANELFRGKIHMNSRIALRTHTHTQRNAHDIWTDGVATIRSVSHCVAVVFL